jgi:ABC-2 type transport system ATP-binding protein
MIDVKKLSKWYGRVLAVDDVSFHVTKGAVVGFLGPNGAGKSTTLKIMTCFLPASSGSVHIDGKDVLADSLAVRQSIGYMPESVPLYPEMRVREYLHFRAGLRDIPAKQRAAAVDRVCERCWLRTPEDMTRRRLGELSRGYKQRVGLAEVMLHDPPVLILDEPTIGLDPGQVRSMRELIGELGQDHTVIFSSHILAEVEQTCNQILLIAGGKLIASGSPADLRRQVAGQDKIIVECRHANADAMAKTLGEHNHVQDVRVSAGEHWTTLEVTPAEGGDPRSAIFHLARDNGWELRELRRTGATLEDFFVQMTYRQSLQPQSA